MSLGRILAKNFKRICSKPHKMTLNAEIVVQNNRKSTEIIDSMKTELSAIRIELIERKKQQLRLENAKLVKEIEAAKARLIALEIQNGKQQLAVPGARSLSTDATQAPSAVQQQVQAPAEKPQQQQQAGPPKEKKPKKEKAPAAPAAAVAEAPVDVGRLDMRVGKIIDVQRHPDADSLYLEKIDCGEPQPRTVVSGLVKFVPIEEMRDRMVIVLCNLKPAKMRGVTSEAMVMCASTPERVEVLSPPAGSVPGDLVHCEGYTRQPDAQLNPKKKVFETCAPDLQTNGDLVACYKGAALHVPGKGKIVAQSLKNVQVK